MKATRLLESLHTLHIKEGKLKISELEVVGENILVEQGRLFVDEKEVELTDADLGIDEPIVISIAGLIASDLHSMAENVDVAGDVEGDAKTVSGLIGCAAIESCAETVSGEICIGGEVKGKADTVSGNISSGCGRVRTAPAYDKKRVERGGGAVLVVNGNRVSGNVFGNVSIIDGQVFVNGQLLGKDDDKPSIPPYVIMVAGSVRGDVETIHGDIRVSGRVDGANSTSGCIYCTGDVGKHVSSVSGSLQVAGLVRKKCSTVSGHIS